MIITQITIEKFLGEGSTSNVYLCSYNTKKYAIKLLKDILIAHSSFIQETKSLNEISHPNITNIIRSGISKIYSNDKIIDNPYILLELAEKANCSITFFILKKDSAKLNPDLFSNRFYSQLKPVMKKT